VASLGSFAAAKREHEPSAEPDTFEFCGETFTVRGRIPGMLQLTVGAWFSGVVGGNEGAAALREVIRRALTAPDSEDDSEWQRFYELALESGVDTEDLAEVAYVILGAEAGRPTGRRSTSSTGSSPTSTSSSGSASDSPASPA
jgi:hypothetical protein